jgi:phospholipase/lecithinase/hemolysin
MLPRFLVLTTVPAVALASALPFLHSHIERLVVFGDSFSDNGDPYSTL